MKTEDKDKIAKDAARRAGAAVPMVARSRAKMTKPGAVSVAADEATRFDERIAEKQQRGDGGVAVGAAPALAPAAAASKPGAVSVASNEASRFDQRIMDKQLQQQQGSSPLKPAPKPAPKATPKEDVQLEADVAAKQRGRSMVGAAATNPGASGESGAPLSVGGGHASTPRTMESDVAAKMRARSGAAGVACALRARFVPKASPGEAVVAPKVQRQGSSRQELSNLEADAQMVSSRKPSARDVKKAPPSVPGARPELTSIEDRIAAKVRRETTGPSSAAKPGVEQPSRLEGKVAAKIGREIASNATPGTRSDLRGLEDSVSTKVRGNEETAPAVPGAHAEKTTLEDSVTAKVRRESSGVTKPTSVAPSSLSPRISSSVIQEGSQRGDRVAHLDARIAAKTATMIGTTSTTVLVSNATDADETSKLSKAVPEQAPSFAKDGAMMTSKVDNLKTAEEKTGKLSKGDLELSTNPDDPFGFSFGGEKGLAIAVAVEEDPDDIFIPSAIEYDPDSKPPVYKNRRFRLYGFLACAIVVLVAIGAAVTGTLGRDDGAGAFEPTAAPTTYRESLGIEAQVKRVVGGELLEDPESPYARALEWITFDDPMQMMPEHPSFIQRYVAAYFYFATSEDGPWRSCNPPEDPWSGETKCSFSKLSSVFPLGFTPIPWNAWLSKISECEWAGIMCDEHGQVRTIDLSGSGLSGTFPEGIYHLPFLQTLQLFWSSLRGPLPVELVEMKHLVNIELHFNMFTGTVPDEWWMARNLQRVNLGDNMLTGTISPTIGNLRDLKGFYFFTNMLTGSVPSDIGLMDSLTYWRAARNDLTGQIPSSIENWKWCQEFWMHRTQLTGSIPEVIGQVSTLQDLRLHGNPTMTGTIPDSLYDLQELYRLDLYGSSFEGTISPKIGNLADSLFSLRISYNKFEGEIPTEFALLTNLDKVNIEGNAFIGSVPQAFCYRDSNSNVNVSAAVELFTINEFKADCAPNEQGSLELDCPCCTECCNPEGTECLTTGLGPGPSA